MIDQMIEHALAMLAVTLLAGCGMFEKRVEYVPYAVNVPVPVPCAAPVPAEPQWATKGMAKVTPEMIDVGVDKLLAERKQRQGFEKQLMAAVEGCQ